MEHGGSLLTLGNQKSLSFSSDGVAQAAWKGPSTEASAGSAIILNDDDNDGAEKENTVCLMKEHDYIGLSTPVQPLAESKNPDDLSLPETDLHLGLGLGLSVSKKPASEENREKNSALPLAQKEGVPKAATEAPSYPFTEGGRVLQKPWPNAGSMRPVSAENLNPLTSTREFPSSKVSLHVHDYGEGSSRVGNTGHSAALKNGTKRGYTEAMNETARFTMATEVRGAGAAGVKNGDGDVKPAPKYLQGAFIPSWSPAKPTLPAQWQGGLEQSAVHSFVTNKLAQITTASRTEKPVADRPPSAYKSHELSEASKEPLTNEPPPSKGQVVGWPPIRSFRKQTLAKPIEMFVKVNMDGMTVGRKVDLNAHSSYEGLLSALEEMFQPSNNGAQGASQAASGRENHLNDVKQLRLLHGSDFVLTYEDQDGDWMLVGDVPWSMFVNMVRRLRITRGSEATGLAPRMPDNIK